VQLADVEELVILDVEWLARVFTSVLARLDAAVDDRTGLVRRSALDCGSVVALLRHFQLCLPIIGTDYELFPCRLPHGRVDDTVWPPAPPHQQRQVRHVTCSVV